MNDEFLRMGFETKNRKEVVELFKDTLLLTTENL